MNKQDTYFMKKALAQADKALKIDEVPIGAVVVSSDGKILGKGYNYTEHGHSQSQHAEVRAMRQAGKKLQNWRLTGCTLYVTLQPCMMCMSLLFLSRVVRLVYATKSPLFGYNGEDENFLPPIYKKHIKEITTGIMADESKKMLELFFKHKRKGE